MARRLMFRWLVNGIKEKISKGWGNLPLAGLLVPLYGLPAFGMELRMVQIQMFQFTSVLIFLIYLRHHKIAFFNPFKLFGVLALAQLVFFNLNDLMILEIQMVLIGYVLFKSVSESEISHKCLQVMVSVLVLVTFFYCVCEKLNIDSIKPFYVNPKYGGLFTGIWTAEAYCGAFSSVSLPIFLMMKSKIKWFFILIVIWMILNSHSSTAVLVAGISILLALALTLKKSRILVAIISTLVLLGVIYYLQADAAIFFGDKSSITQRAFIWKLTWVEITKNFFGNGLGSFFKFGFENIFVHGPARGLFFSEPHNIILQSLYEFGIIGFLVCCYFIGRIFYITLKSINDVRVSSVGLSLISFIGIMMLQPLLSLASMASVGIVLYGALESYHARKLTGTIHDN